jgi:hypothetical protein
VAVSVQQCKDDEEKTTYPNISIVADNAVAAVCFHTIFREVENAWALVDSVSYTDLNINYQKEHRTKSLSYVASSGIITIEYHAWATNFKSLGGTINVEIPILSYGVKDMLAKISLSGFSIDGQDITGGGNSTLKYNKGETDENDKYLFNLSNTDIHEMGVNKPVLISGSISNGLYERTEGGDTPSMNDDEWKYTGNMTGMLMNDPKLKYTNRVIEALYFTMNCKTAKKGHAQITIAGREEIRFLYGCTEIYYEGAPVIKK